MQVLVLGAGLAGLSSAWHLLRQGHSVCLLERDERVGGLASSVQVGPYSLDHGPHKFHSRDPELARHFREILDGQVVRCEQRSRVYRRGAYFDYPLRLANVLGSMPATVLARAGVDYLWARARRRLSPTPERDFESWVVARFGRTVYREFIGAYVAKAWRMPCAEISADWAAQRIGQTDLWDVIKQTVRPAADGADRSLADSFDYPARGGIGELARGYEMKIRALGGELRLATSLERLELEGNRVARVISRYGDELEAHTPDVVVNTTPLPELLGRVLARGLPWISLMERRAIESLQFVGVLFVYIEVQRPQVMSDHWVYLPSPDTTVHRVSEFKNFSPSCAPAESTAICCEIACRPGDERWNLPPKQLAEIARADLVRAGLLRRGEGRVLHHARKAHAYPVYDLHFREHREVLLEAVGRIANLHSTGRQGLYRHNQMDHSIAMGRKIARTLGPSEGPAPALPSRPVQTARAPHPALRAEILSSLPEYLG